MDELERIHAVILRTADYGETDRMLTLLTKEQGLVHVGAKGARKPRSRFFGLTDPFCLIEGILQKRGPNLFLQQVSLMDSLYALRVQPVAMAYASYLCALCEAALPQQEKDEELYEALLRALFLLREGVPAASVCVPFSMFLFRKSGFAPDLNACVLCGSREAGRFSVEKGGLVCDRCRPYERRISEETLSCLRVCGDMAAMPLASVTQGAMELCGLYAARHFEKDFPAWQVARRMDASQTGI